MMTTIEEQLYDFCHFLGSKKHWEEKSYLKILVSRDVFKKGDFCSFLASKNYDKIWHCFNIFCDFCDLEIFCMSPVGDTIFTIYRERLCFDRNFHLPPNWLLSEVNPNPNTKPWALRGGCN